MAQHSYSGIKAYEYWHPVPGYEGLYEVSDMGNFRNVKFGRTKHVTPDKEGYVQVRLCKNGKATTHRAARLVLAAFVGDNPSMEAAHINNIRTDNRLTNLCWQTRTANEAHKTATGQRPKSTRGMFTERLVSVVRDMRNSGFLYEEMAALFGCHYTTLAFICNKTTWK